MKRSPQDQRIIDRMAPGALCREGFLGHDRRDLSEIIAADDATVVAAALTHQQIAEALSAALDAAVAALGRPVGLAAGLTATWGEAMGRIASPWPGEGVWPKGQVELTDRRTGRTLYVTALSVHLIAAHGFYQGRGSRYRLEPAELIDLLDVAG